MKIGILGAMLEEVSSIKDLMIINRETTVAGRHYIEGKIGDQEIVLVFSRWGKVAAACTSTTLINKFGVNFILFTGVAGAVKDSLNIGDIVIASGLYQHDMDARPFFDQFQIPLTTTIIFKPNSTEVTKAKVAAERFLTNMDAYFPQNLLNQYQIHNPKVHTGLIASGDKFIANPKTHINLSFSNNGNTTLAVEMEGAAVAQVCDEHSIPYIVIRIISDKADHSAAIDFQSFIGNVANRYSSGIVNEFILAY